MKASDVFPGKYLKAVDLGTSTPVVVIAKVVMEKITDDETKPVVYFVGKEKGVVLNKTNFNTIEEITGEPDTDHWKGSRIMLITAKVEFQGKRVLGIRIEPPPSAARPAGTLKRVGKPAPPPEPEPEPDVDEADEPIADDAADDDIPF